MRRRGAPVVLSGQEDSDCWRRQADQPGCSGFTTRCGTSSNGRVPLRFPLQILFRYRKQLVRSRKTTLWNPADYSARALPLHAGNNSVQQRSLLFGYTADSIETVWAEPVATA